MTNMAKVIEEFLHFLAKTVCAKEDGKSPFCKSLVAVLVTEGLSSAAVGLGEQEDGWGCCGLSWAHSNGAVFWERVCLEECLESLGTCWLPSTSLGLCGSVLLAVAEDWRDSLWSAPEAEAALVEGCQEAGPGEVAAGGCATVGQMNYCKRELEAVSLEGEAA